ncbi:MAG: arginine--tRNA ligase, partial [Acidobacteriales bacterium]|nr:arginine--tRNA ligase [Terriglobales bacterium]
MYLHLKQRLRRHFREFLQRAYNLDFPRITIEEPPRVELGEYALPLAFELAKTLRKPPRKIAEEIIHDSGPLAGFKKFELAGGGYINARVDRATMATALTADHQPDSDVAAGKVIVEHTSINPNKAAHIGHLRNAILGDTFVRLLKFAGKEVDVQNYIDNTGVQVADIIVGFLQIEKKSGAEIEQLIRTPRFDFYCWDLYARVSQWYAQDEEKLQFRSQALHDMERGGNETSAIAETISGAISHLHLQTMERLGITYDLLPRESEILRLHFWDAAFEKLKSTGVLFYEEAGKNRGCWVMRRAGTAKNDTRQVESATDGAAGEVSEEDQKVIVRSNGTVGYVGKDIAYHMWKFGLLGKDFEYQPFYRYNGGKDCWISTVHGVPDHPHFGG